MRRGQSLSLFIILGLFVLAILGVLLYLGPSLSFKNSYTLNDLEEAYTDCARQAFLETLVLMGKNGGYVNPPAELVGTNGVTYLYRGGGAHALSLADAGVQVETGVRNLLPKYCEPITEAFTKKGIAITQTEPTIRSTFNEEDTVLEVLWKTTASQGDRRSEMEQVSVTEDVRLGAIITGTKNIVDAYAQTGEVLRDPKAPKVEIQVAHDGATGIIFSYVDGTGQLTGDDTPYRLWFGLTDPE